MPTTLSLITFAVSVVLYGISSTLFYLEVARGPESGTPKTVPVWMLGIAGASHTGYIIIASFVARVCPIHSVHFILSIGSLASTAIYLAARVRFKINALGLVVAPLGLAVIVGTFFLGHASPGTKMPASFMALHILANTIGSALFLLACGAAVMYLVQDKRLKNKKALLLKKGTGLPPLDALDHAVHRFLMAGFPLLTLGVATGTVWAHKLESGSAADILRSVLGYATWLLIAGVLLLRVVLGWRGRRAAYGTVAGFLCALAVFILYIVRAEVVGG
ncbi:MAG: cytochrome c biogenesis protein CcsA [Polyangiaceae bacterium]